MNTLSDKDAINTALETQQSVQKQYYDRNAGPNLPELYAGQRVRYQHDKGDWIPAKVIGHSDQPRSYILETPNGGHLRRNRRHIAEIPVPESPSRPQGDEQHE